MGCVSSKILTKSGSFQEKVSFGHSFQRSNVIEEIILSTSKSNGDQFLALLCSSNSSARKAKEPEQSPAGAEPAAKIETINVAELLAGLEEESCAAEQEQERRSSRTEGDDRAPAAPCASDSGGAAGRARSFRTLEEFDALVTQQSSSPERATAPATEQEELATRNTATTTSSHGGATAAESSGSPGRDEPAGVVELAQGAAEAAGTKRRARARQLGELKVPPAFDFTKSGSLRDWLRHGGQIFSPGSYVTPKFGTEPALPAEHGGGEGAGERQQEQDTLFDPELVAQFERAMEQLSEDEGRVLEEILAALESGAGENDGTTAFGAAASDGQPAAEAVQQV